MKLLRNLLAFMLTFLFIQICGIYIMGGFYNQTTESKFISIVAGIIIGLAALAIIETKENFKP